MMAFSESFSVSLVITCRINLLLNTIEWAADNISHSLLSCYSRSKMPALRLPWQTL